MATSSATESFDRLWQQYLWIGVAVGAGVLLYLAWMLIRFRSRQASGEEVANGGLRRDRPAPWWVAAAMVGAIALILFPLSLSTMGTHEQMEHPPPGDAVTIHVSAFRFGWLFQYPEGFQTLNDLRFPLGTNVILDIESQDVMHKFHIADYHVGIDAMPGQATQVWFRTDDPTPTTIHCAELCGPGHALMVATVRPMDAGPYQAWAAEQASGRTTGLTQHVSVLYDGTLMQPALLRTIAGADTYLEFTNRGTEPVAFRLAGPVANQTAVVAPGGTAWLNFTAGQPGDILGHAVDSAGNEVGVSATLRVLAPVRVEVVLKEFSIEAQGPAFTVGTPVVFQVSNDGSMPHDFAVGDWAADDAAKRIEAKTPVLNAGETGVLAYWPGEAGSIDGWCNIPGHAQMGMKTTLEASA